MARTSVPHDLTDAERRRLADEMLRGFRYCRLAGGLYWRGTDEQQKRLEPRWPEQLDEVRELLDAAGVEGLSMEYWSPAPHWKANRGYTKATPGENVLRCFGTDFGEDSEYHGDVDRFLADFASACVDDLKTLESHGLRIDQWGMQNEPWVNQVYSSCEYTIPNYGTAFRAVAPAIRAYDPKIKILADTAWGAPRFIAPVMKTPAAKYVDALVVHAIGDDSRKVLDCFRQTRQIIDQQLPIFQNEYEYLQGPASPDRCHNTVQNIMNWFQLAGSPTWYWIHALKPMKNAEASGYSLGFWRPLQSPSHAEGMPGRRWKASRHAGRGAFRTVPEALVGTYCVSPPRGELREPGNGFAFTIDKRCEAFLLVHQRGDASAPAGWEPTDLVVGWHERETDRVFRRVLEPGTVIVPAHDGDRERGYHGAPHTVLLRDISNTSVVVRVTDLPYGAAVAELSESLDPAVEALEPGHWTWNSYNWRSVVGFLRHMPWESTVVRVEEDRFDDDMRVLAYRKPSGKLVVVVANRCWSDFTFEVETGLADATFEGFRYTPHDAGEGGLGRGVGVLSGPIIRPTTPDLSWEFWVQR